MIMMMDEAVRRAIAQVRPGPRMDVSEFLTKTAANVMRVCTTCRVWMSSCYR